MLAHQFGTKKYSSCLMQRSNLGLRLAVDCEWATKNWRRVDASIRLDCETAPQGLSPHIGAAVRNNARRVGMMLGAGWPANIQERTPLDPAALGCVHGNVEMVRELLVTTLLLEAEEQQFNGTPLGLGAVRF